MRIRSALAVASLGAALFATSAPAAIAAAGSSAKGDVGVNLTGDETLANGAYTISFNSSGNGTKSSGGYSVTGPQRFFLSGRTVRYCPLGSVIAIVNTVDPKKSSQTFNDDYFVIYVKGTNTIDVEGFSYLPECTDPPLNSKQTYTVTGTIRIT